VPSNSPFASNPANEAMEIMRASAVRWGESYDSRLIQGSAFGLTSKSVEFEGCQFAATDLSKSKWQKVTMINVQIDACDLANARWSNVIWEKVELKKCRGVGLQLLDANCIDSLFVNCKFHLGAFHGSRFRNCRWENCDLREANFEGTEFIDVIFRSCDLRAARFPNCSAKNLDLRESHLAGLQIDPARLRGTRVDLSQLPALAEIFGLTIEPVDDDLHETH